MHAETQPTNAAESDPPTASPRSSAAPDVELLSHRALPRSCVMLSKRPGAVIDTMLMRPTSPTNHRCVMLSEWCPRAVQDRGMAALATTLTSRSLDASAALEVLRRHRTVPRLLEILHEGPNGSAQIEALASATSSRGSRVAPPPSQPDPALRRGALHLLTQIAQIGGKGILEPMPHVTAVCRSQSTPPFPPVIPACHPHPSSPLVIPTRPSHLHPHLYSHPYSCPRPCPSPSTLYPYRR